MSCLWEAVYGDPWRAPRAARHVLFPALSQSSHGAALAQTEGDRMPTARSIVRGALMDIGVVAQEEPMTASMAEDALELLNALLDSFSLERLWIYHTPATPIVWPAGSASMTWGPGGDMPSSRPIKLAPQATYQDVTAGYDYQLEVLERQEQYAQLTWKGMQSTLPSALYYEPQMPLGVLYIWPVPSVGYQITVYPWQVLGAFTAFDDELQFPPGYLRALRTSLAVEAAPSYGVTPSPLLLRISEEAKRALFVPNTVVGRLSLYPGASAPMSGLASFYSGRG
jgi:hypothetical protein